MSHHQQISRRSFLRAATKTIAAAALAGPTIAGYSALGEPGWLATEHIAVAIAGLHLDLAGLTIVQLSDIHASREVRSEWIDRAVAAANELRPDLIVLTGDYVSHGLGYLPGVAAQLAALRAPLGVFATLGNHDHWTGAPGRVAAALTDGGIAMLRNRGTAIERGAGALWLAGVDDIWERQADPEAAFAAAPRDLPRLLLAHEPDFADTAAGYGVALQLSGHTHGGQVRVPGFGAPVIPRYGTHYPIGLRRVAGSQTQVYTNRGVGMVSPAVRLNCRPEVTQITLLPAASVSSSTDSL